MAEITITTEAPETEAEGNSSIRYMRRARIRCSASRLGNVKEQKNLKVNLQ